MIWWPFSEGEFDAVYSIAALMHLQKGQIPEKVRDIHRVLKDGGESFGELPVRESG